MRRIAAFLALVAVTIPGLAVGQADPRTQRAPSTDTARTVLAGYAECVLRRDQGKVDAFLATSPFDPSFGRRGADISSSDCLVGGRLRFSALLLRGALFAAKYRREFGREAPVMMIGAMNLVPLGVSEWAPDGGAAVRLTVSAADCIALRDRDGARTLILAPVGSKVEKQMIARLSPVTSACAPGLDLARAREPIEAALAEVMYRRAAEGRAMGGDKK